jgi:hypothetical protein
MKTANQPTSPMTSESFETAHSSSKARRAFQEPAFTRTPLADLVRMGASGPITDGARGGGHV